MTILQIIGVLIGLAAFVGLIVANCLKHHESCGPSVAKDNRPSSLSKPTLKPRLSRGERCGPGNNQQARR